MALLGFMRLGPVLLVIFPALSLACMLPAPDQALAILGLEFGSVLVQTQADPWECQSACCNRTECDIAQVNVNQEGAGPNCMLIKCVHNCLRPKDQKQGQVQIYLKNGTRFKPQGLLRPLMIQPVPETRETNGSDAEHDGTEGGEPEGSPAHNETDTETGDTETTDTETGETKNTDTKGVRDGEQPAESDQDRNARCRLPKVVGPCRAAFLKFFYDPTSQTCSSFTYGGCGANANNFQTQEECEDTCGGVTGEVLPEDSSTGSRQINAEVLPSKGVIKPADAPSDSSDMTALCFAPPDGGRCRGYFPMFHYDPNTNECHEFIYGGCQGNKNRYSSLEECMNTCSGGGLFGARGSRRSWTAGVFLFVALAAISALLLGALIAITLRRNRLPCHPPSSISDKEELLHDDASSLDSVGIPASPVQSQA